MMPGEKPRDTFSPEAESFAIQEPDVTKVGMATLCVFIIHFSLKNQELQQRAG